MQVIEYAESAHAVGVSAVLGSLGWEQRYIDGQLGAVARLAFSSDGCVYVATMDGHVVGYVAAVLARWNMLGQIHGLAVDPGARRGGVARALVTAAEERLRSYGARGVHVDTPVDNLLGRGFYEAIGFTQDYIMSRYYADDLDGVTYVRFY
ncbi:ribosomal protein S18 acetylase RimI-like enzyme [Micromonospora pisi]|uniref:Ribosomal protein S18 acetylase RimI-like enzyme n=1 Tax=Micromonospora pisi TaxID=589240 RepID=A0A495JV39_9ACTN|nr:GNAT family N-acetyltransferase [Micromonospora pisi]RKR92886.1 ribosomal protein S18 acetylase RimI-like enzyme [Micromonospora pisi]